MKINSKVIISSEYSIKFANMTGVIKEIEPKRGLSLRVQFNIGGGLYWFSPEEVTLVED